MALASCPSDAVPYCIELHLKAAREEGATDKMLSETATVAAAMKAGAAVTHATRWERSQKGSSTVSCP